MKYKNPIILGDYSDPDVIRYKDSFYLIASSFNHTPIIPILKSKNLIDWKILRYVSDKLPYERFNEVCHGEGIWAPAIRYHNGYFYITAPMPDEGIFVYRTDDIEKGEFESWLLIPGKGLEDPCPIWTDDGRCFIVIGFAKSRAGFNSCLGLYEVTPDLKQKITDNYTIIFDGHDTQPTIEGPKFYYRNDMYYILAPAGSVKTGWQTALRSKNIYGPYEQKIVMAQNDSKINGPHQGALVDLADGRDVFFHFQDLGPYGRIVHLEPVTWHNNWPIIGDARDLLLTGTPVSEYDYFIDEESNNKIETSDLFNKNKLSLMWQLPANQNKAFYSINNGLEYKCLYYNKNGKNALNKYPGSLLTKVAYESFKVKTEINANFVDNNDEAGLMVMGKEYAYISLERINNKNYICIKEGKFESEYDEITYKEEYDSNNVIFNLEFKYPGIYRLGFNNKFFKKKYIAYPGRWIGTKYGIFARGNNDLGYATFKYFKVKEVK